MDNFQGFFSRRPLLNRFSDGLQQLLGLFSFLLFQLGIKMAEVGEGRCQVEEGGADGLAAGVTAFHTLGGRVGVRFRLEVVGR